jgi:HD-GYP domain-containing protein (c-di-GMP phosphodiesterase class II)
MRTATKGSEALLGIHASPRHVSEAPMHGLRVALIAAAVAAELGLDALRRQRVATAGLLHDLGKVTVPPEIWAKKGPLSDAEWQLVRGHPEASRRIAVTFTDDDDVLGAIHAHHERWEGTGYPDGLAAAAIPTGGRILAVADAFTAMTEDRPYRPAASYAHALLELRSGRGRQFDPDCVDAFEQATTRLRRRGKEGDAVAAGEGPHVAGDLGGLLKMVLELA